MDVLVPDSVDTLTVVKGSRDSVVKGFTPVLDWDHVSDWELPSADSLHLNQQNSFDLDHSAAFDLSEPLALNLPSDWSFGALEGDFEPVRHNGSSDNSFTGFDAEVCEVTDRSRRLRELVDGRAGAVVAESVEPEEVTPDFVRHTRSMGPVRDYPFFSSCTVSRNILHFYRPRSRNSN